MPLKPYSELVQIDVLPFCDMREGKDDANNKINIPFLNWAKCKQLLHENGAESVYYTPLKDDNGSFVFCSKEVSNKDGRRTGCYFVAVDIHIDDKCYRMDMPLLNGSLVVYEDTLNQLRIANCHARAFVKGVAIHTGLGFQLWVKELDTDPAEDDLSGHSIYAIKERVERTITAKLQHGGTLDELLSAVGMKRSTYEKTMTAIDNLALLEKKLREL